MAISEFLLGMIVETCSAFVQRTISDRAPKEFTFAMVHEERRMDYVRQALKHLPDDLLQGSEVEPVQAFLAGPIAASILNKCLVLSLSESESEAAYHLQQHFAAELARESKIPSNRCVEIARKLVPILLESLNQMLFHACERGNIAALDARDIFRQRQLLLELEGLKRSVAELNKFQKLDAGTLSKTDAAFRTVAIQRFKHLEPPTFDQAYRVDIDSLYVEPMLKSLDSNKEHSLSDFSTWAHRSVILGDPGAGKSTLTAKIAFDLCVNGKNHFLNQRLLPLHVTLRDYAAHKNKSSVSIKEYLEMSIRTEWQVEIPANWIDYVLLNNLSLVIFDGLDELLDTSDRRKMAREVESFCTIYPTVPVLITSRRVGYEQAPLDKEMFRLYEIAPFDDERVERYARLWFTAQPPRTGESAIEAASAFMAESQNILDLRSNPLMLALLCNFYRGRAYLPKNRPEVYQRCSQMLFERWDQERKIIVQLPFESHLRPAMMHIAGALYPVREKDPALTAQELVQTTADYLFPRRFETREEAEGAAQQFIEFCKGRAWVFTDAGANREGKPLFKFTHQTFLEYFAASHYVRTHSTSFELLRFLYPKIAKREWDVVAQLAIHISSDHANDSPDIILAYLLTESSKEEWRKKANVMSFVVRALEFLVPSPAIIRKVVSAVVGLLVELFALQRSRGLSTIAQEIVISLFKTEAENTPIVKDELWNSSLDRILNADIASAAKLLEWLSLTHRHFSLYSSPAEREGHEDFAAKLFKVAVETRPELQSQNYYIALMSLWRHYISLRRFVELWGEKGLFKSYNPPESSISFISPVGSLAFNLLNGRDMPDQKWSNFSDLAELFDEGVVSWQNSKGMGFTHRENQARTDLGDRTAKELFGIALVISLQIKKRSDVVRYREVLEAMSQSSPVLNSWFRAIESSRPEDAIFPSGLTWKQTEWLVQWISGLYSVRDR